MRLGDSASAARFSLMGPLLSQHLTGGPPSAAPSKVDPPCPSMISAADSGQPRLFLSAGRRLLLWSLED